MKSEFPFDKWFRKYASPLRVLFFVVISIAIIFIIPYIVATNIPLAIYLFMFVFLFALVGCTIWQICWRIKHPFHPEFCKECNQVLPEKFED